MPIYDYRCASCGTVFEDFVWGSTESWQRARCPKCGGEASRDHTGDRSASVLRVGRPAAPEFVKQDPPKIGEQGLGNVEYPGTVTRVVYDAGASGVNYIDEAAEAAVAQLAQRLKQQMAESLAPATAVASQLPSVLDALRRMEERLQRIEAGLIELRRISPMAPKKIDVQEGNAG
jgi:putative FmdB family regulatory protein